ncbi:MAG TPA: phytanoyl-CoA dioxygenase family protein [Kofleriaceae bacterium]|nr:phytanoyl-CoA dioxygenase family protein [Kofleriaceae bacterium]
MIDIDYRTRTDAQIAPVDFTAFHHQLPARLRGKHGALAARALGKLGLPPLALEVDGRAFTYVARDGAIEVVDGATADAVVAPISAALFTELVLDLRTTTSAVLGGLVRLAPEHSRAFMQWDPVLRAMLDGRAIHEPGTIGFVDRDGAPLDVRRAFPASSDPAEILWFLQQTGFVILQGLFTPDEMAEVSADLDRIADSYRPGDGQSWWARTASAGNRLVRLKEVQQRSPVVARLLRDPRYLALADMWPARYPRDRRTASPIDACIKPADTVEGVSDMNWHKDCSLGRHSYDCCNFGVGFSVTDSSEDHGQLSVVAGSHRTQLPLVRNGAFAVELPPDLDLPVVPLSTRAGDVTIHLSCAMHRAMPPRRHERRVMYSGYILEADHRLAFTGDGYAALLDPTKASRAAT